MDARTEFQMILGEDGTPAFVVGDTLIPGEDLEALKAAIERARGRVAR